MQQDIVPDMFYSHKDKISKRSSWNTAPLFTKRTDVLPQDLVKSRSREIHV